MNAIYCMWGMKSIETHSISRIFKRKPDLFPPDSGTDTKTLAWPVNPVCLAETMIVALKRLTIDCCKNIQNGDFS